MKDAEIGRALKRLRGEAPSGRVFNRIGTDHGTQFVPEPKEPPDVIQRNLDHNSFSPCDCGDCREKALREHYAKLTNEAAAKVRCDREMMVRQQKETAAKMQADVERSMFLTDEDDGA